MDKFFGFESGGFWDLLPFLVLGELRWKTGVFWGEVEAMEVMEATKFLEEIVDCGLWIVDCGLWIVDCGLWIAAT